mmetsp:Transcript_20021/g.50472  ORF Transcript_20021/g.50472 Transcript_20021/m.50472 type:complete len:556 (+) Transcript_20021:194-1861(+)
MALLVHPQWVLSYVVVFSYDHGRGSFPRPSVHQRDVFPLFPSVGPFPVVCPRRSRQDLLVVLHAVLQLPPLFPLLRPLLLPPLFQVHVDPARHRVRCRPAVLVHHVHHLCEIRQVRRILEELALPRLDVGDFLHPPRVLRCGLVLLLDVELPRAVPQPVGAGQHLALLLHVDVVRELPVLVLRGFVEVGPPVIQIPRGDHVQLLGEGRVLLALGNVRPVHAKINTLVLVEFLPGLLHGRKPFVEFVEVFYGEPSFVSCSSGHEHGDDFVPHTPAPPLLYGVVEPYHLRRVRLLELQAQASPVALEEVHADDKGGVLLDGVVVVLVRSLSLVVLLVLYALPHGRPRLNGKTSQRPVRVGRLERQRVEILGLRRKVRAEGKPFRPRRLRGRRHAEVGTLVRHLVEQFLSLAVRHGCELVYHHPFSRGHCFVVHHRLVQIEQVFRRHVAAQQLPRSFAVQRTARPGIVEHCIRESGHGVVQRSAPGGRAPECCIGRTTVDIVPHFDHPLPPVGAVPGAVPGLFPCPVRRPHDVVSGLVHGEGPHRPRVPQPLRRLQLP